MELKVLVLLTYVVGSSQGKPCDLDEEQWFNIVNVISVCCCRLAIELDEDNCQLVLRPWNYRAVGQQWRWDGRMIKSRVNGKVWVNRGDTLMVGTASRSPDRQFVYFGDKDLHIYVDDEYLNYSKAVDLMNVPPLIGQSISVYGTSGSVTQHFQLNYHGINTCVEEQ